MVRLGSNKKNVASIVAETPDISKGSCHLSFSGFCPLRGSPPPPPPTPLTENQFAQKPKGGGDTLMESPLSFLGNFFLKGLKMMFFFSFSKVKNGPKRPYNGPKRAKNA